MSPNRPAEGRDDIRGRTLLKTNRVAREYLIRADHNLDGTYIVRLFAAFGGGRSARTTGRSTTTRPARSRRRT